MNKRLLTGLFCSLMLAACTERGPDKGAPSAAAPPTKFVPGDARAGRAIAERDCRTCHGMDGRSVAPGIPHLAAQRERYLIMALTEYLQVKRTHSALRAVAERLKPDELRNVVAYYASLPPLPSTADNEQRQGSLLEHGRELAAGCVKCHGEGGNSTTPGVPTLAGQQPHYLLAAIDEYHRGERGSVPMRSILSDASRADVETLVLYFASQTPAQRAAPPAGDPAAGEPLTAMCGGCHGLNGVSNDAATPSLAGQDPGYLAKSIKAYRTTRKHWGMQRYVGALADKDIENISAFYAVQKSQPAGGGVGQAKELAEKCDRCHDVGDNPQMVVPVLKGQDKDYLVMALRAYRDDKRESTTMHKMSVVYSNALIEELASYYASQPRPKQ